MGAFDTAKTYAQKLADALRTAATTGAEMYGSASQPAPPEVVKGVLGFAPVAGDAISAYDAYDAAKQGNYGEAALNAVGLLPFIPSLGGVVKQVGNIPKNGILPKGVTQDMIQPGVSEMFGTGMAGTIKKMTNGDFLGRYIPAWKNEGNPFYAIGDDASELKQFMLDRMGRSEAGTVSAKKAKFNNSLLGMLQKKYGDVFDTAHSTQSKSQYITHTPSGTKIRISDHDLPLHYEQPDVDLRISMTNDEQLAAIIKALSNE